MDLDNGESMQFYYFVLFVVSLGYQIERDTLREEEYKQGLGRNSRNHCLSVNDDVILKLLVNIFVNNCCRPIVSALSLILRDPK